MTTHHLMERLAEIGCVVATEGAAGMVCASDLAKNVLDSEIGHPGIPADAVGGVIPNSSSDDVVEGNYCKADPESDSCFTPNKRLIGSLCGCFNPSGDMLVGSIEANTKSGATPGMIEIKLVPPKPGNPGFPF